MGSTAFAAVLIANDAAQAACTPAAADNVTAICTDATNNQGPWPGGGYGDGGLTLYVTVAPGATVTGTNSGLFFAGGTVQNFGTISGGNAGIYTGTATVTNSGTITGNYGITAITATVTNSGSITAGTTGINVTNATVANSGAISGGDYGIFGGSTATVTNSGTITAGTTGIYAGVTATVTNSGTISGDVRGIAANATATVTNSGTISGVYGIVANATATVTNSGTIMGILDTGIYAGTTANVTNSGSITGGPRGISAFTANVSNSGSITGDYGVDASRNATVSNSGAILGGDTGIRAGTTAAVTTSGTIIGGSGTAIRFNAFGGPASDSLTILPGARFGGLVDFGGGADRATFGPGSWILNTANFDAALSSVATAGNPYVVTANKIIVADLSGFGAMNRAVMDITGWISSVLPETPVFETAQTNGAANAFAAIERTAPRLDDAFAFLPSGALPYAPAPVFKGGTVSDAAGNTLWAKGFGGYRDQGTDGSFIGSVTQGYGGAIGFDRQVTANTKLGAFLGGSSNNTRLQLNAGQTDTDTLFGGVYARKLLGASFLDLALIGGSLDNKSKRNIGGGLAWETASASYGGWFVNPALTLGHRFALADNLTLTPALKLRYVAAHFDGYTESGSTTNLTVAGRNVQALEERAELTLASVQNWNGNRIIVRNTVGALAQQRTGDSNVNVALVGTNFIAATPDKGNVFGLYGGAGIDWQIGRAVLFASGEVTGMTDNTTSFAGKGGLRVVW